MTDTSAPASRGALLARLAIVATALSGVLGGWAPLLLAKALLPLHAASPATWTATVTLFLVGAALGTGGALRLRRVSPRLQPLVPAVFALLALVALRFPREAGGDGFFAALGNVAPWAALLAVLIGGAPRVLTIWAREERGDLPAHLPLLGWASLAGSAFLHAVLLDPWMELDTQLWLVRALVALLAAILLAGGGARWRQAPTSTPARRTPARGPRWALLAISALGGAQFMAGTGLLISQFGPGPLAWAPPLACHAAGLALVFSGRWPSWLTAPLAPVFAFILAAHLPARGLAPTPLLGGVLGTALALLFLGGLLHAALGRARAEGPYLMEGLVSAAAGAWFVAEAAPRLWPLSLEWVGVSVALLTLASAALVGARRPAQVLALALVLAAPAAGLLRHQLQQHPAGLEQTRLRDRRGGLLVESNPNGVVLSDETSTISSQLVADDGARSRPTLHLTESSPPGRLFSELTTRPSAVRCGVLGVGGSALALYAREQDSVDLWEAGALRLETARRHFTHLALCRGRLSAQPVDGRRALEKDATDYDLLVIDGGGAPGVPTHWLTREALDVFTRRLRVRDGILLVHTSSRHANIYPALSVTANSLGLAAVSVETYIAGAGADADWDPANSSYVLIGRPERVRAALNNLPPVEGEGRVRRDILHIDPLELPLGSIWTDQRHALLPALLPAALLGAAPARGAADAGQ